jgi:adenylate kinase family enzyme
MSGSFTQRTVVIGNSGSGKSTLGERLAALAGVPAIDLDLLHWEGDGYGAKREERSRGNWCGRWRRGRAG